MDIVICPLAFDAMVTHLLAVYPEEGCGILGLQGNRYCHHYPIENVLHSPVAYLMDPKQQVEALLAVDSDHEETAIFYHSHPHSPAFPSESDLQQATYPEAIYLIVSLQQKSKPVARAFYLHQEWVSEVTIRIG